jgi:hypothetical protein
MIVLMTVSIGSANAQRAVWGVRAGASYSMFDISGDPSSLHSLRYSHYGGFGFEIGPVLYYSLKNNFYINSGAMTKIIIADNLYFLDIPLYLGYKFGNSGTVSFYGQAGPFAGLNLEGIFGSSGFNNANFGLAAMLGVNFNRFKIEAGYQKGLVNMWNSTVLEDIKMKINSLFLGVNYIF